MSDAYKAAYTEWRRVCHECEQARASGNASGRHMTVLVTAEMEAYLLLQRVVADELRRTI